MHGVGGKVGTPAEAATAKAWPNYELAYLANRLGGGTAARDVAYTDRYAAAGHIPDTDKRNVYLEKAVSQYKQEADEVLKNEFNEWLQGAHEDNRLRNVYENKEGKPMRRHVFRDTQSRGGGTKGLPGETLEGWRPTWWGKAQMTHLPGVREHLRSQLESGEWDSYKMNQMAEMGPQNLEEAYMYFMHWVKGRPLHDIKPMHSRGKIGDHGGAGSNPPDNFYKSVQEDKRRQFGNKMINLMQKKRAFDNLPRNATESEVEDVTEEFMDAEGDVADAVPGDPLGDAEADPPPLVQFVDPGPQPTEIVLPDGTRELPDGTEVPPDPPEVAAANAFDERVEAMATLDDYIKAGAVPANRIYQYLMDKVYSYDRNSVDKLAAVCSSVLPDDKAWIQYCKGLKRVRTLAVRGSSANESEFKIAFERLSLEIQAKAVKNKVGFIELNTF